MIRRSLINLAFFLLMAVALIAAGIVIVHVGRDWLSHSVLSPHPRPVAGPR